MKCNDLEFFAYGIFFGLGIAIFGFIAISMIAHG